MTAPTPHPEDQRLDLEDLLPKAPIIWADDEELGGWKDDPWTYAKWARVAGHGPMADGKGCEQCGYDTSMCMFAQFHSAMTTTMIRELDKIGALALVRPVSQDTEDSPEVVCICGSMRFRDLMLRVAADETSAGRIVLMPFAVVAPVDQGSDFKRMLDTLHRRKIDMADRVIVVMEESEYYGESTRGEIEYASRTGKTVSLQTVETGTFTSPGEIERPPVTEDSDYREQIARVVESRTEDSPDVREQIAPNQELWRCDNGNLYRWSDQGVWEGMPFSGGPWWESSWDGPEAMVKAGLRLVAVPDALSWHVGQEVEWNPAECDWRPGVIAEVTDGLAAVVLHGGQRLNVETRHLRPVLAVSPLVEQLRQAWAEAAALREKVQTQHEAIESWVAYRERVKRDRHKLADRFIAALGRQGERWHPVEAQPEHVAALRAERDRLRLAWQSAARGRMRARIERDTLGAVGQHEQWVTRQLVTRNRELGQARTELAAALDGESRARQECNEAHEEIVRMRRLVRGMARRVGQYRRAKSEETRALWAMEGERNKVRFDLRTARADLETRTRERDEARGAVQNAMAKNADNIADRERMLRDIMAERDQERAGFRFAEKQNVILRAERDKAIRERDERSDLIDAMTREMADLRTELESITPKSVVHQCCEEVVAARARVDALEVERAVLADRVAALQSPDAHRIDDVQRIAQLEFERDEARRDSLHIRSEFAYVCWLHAEAVWHRSQLKVEADHQWGMRLEMGRRALDMDTELTETVDKGRWLLAESAWRLGEAVELAGEAVPYAGDYFDQKWQLSVRLAEMESWRAAPVAEVDKSTPGPLSEEKRQALVAAVESGNYLACDGEWYASLPDCERCEATGRASECPDCDGTGKIDPSAAPVEAETPAPLADRLAAAAAFEAERIQREAAHPALRLMREGIERSQAEAAAQTRDEVVAEWAATWDGVDRSGLPGGPVVGVDVQPPCRICHLSHACARPCTEFEGGEGDEWCPRCGWHKDRHPPVASPGTGTETGE